MFNLPEKTLCNKKIPKNKFYEKLKANTKLKEKFISQIEYIVWKYKISKHTVNIEPAKDVEEIQVFEIHLKNKELSQEVLESIDRFIPYPVLFVLFYGNQFKLAMAYKKRSKHKEDCFVIDSYLYSEWQIIDNVSLELLKGSNLRHVYENILKNLIPVRKSDTQSIEKVIEKQKEAKKIERDIKLLEAKIEKEGQFKQKVKYNLELQEKKKELQWIIEWGSD